MNVMAGTRRVHPCHRVRSGVSVGEEVLDGRVTEPRRRNTDRETATEPFQPSHLKQDRKGSTADTVKTPLPFVPWTAESDNQRGVTEFGTPSTLPPRARVYFGKPLSRRLKQVYWEKSYRVSNTVSSEKKGRKTTLGTLGGGSSSLSRTHSHPLNLWTLTRTSLLGNDKQKTLLENFLRTKKGPTLTHP